MGSISEGKSCQHDWGTPTPGHECEAFPILPPSVREPQPDSIVRHEFEGFHSQSLKIETIVLTYAAWALVVGSLTNATDVVFGVSTSNKAVPFCVELKHKQTIAKYLQAVQKLSLSRLSLEQADAQTLKRRYLNFQRKYQIQTLISVRSPKDALIDSINGDAQNDSENTIPGTHALTLHLWLDTERVAVKASYDSRVITKWLMQKLLQRLEIVIRQLFTMSSNFSVKEVHIMTDRDLTEIWEWNSNLPQPIKRCVPEIFEKHVVSQPDAPAICAWDGKLTYAELNRLASQLAYKLTGHGVAPGEIVPLCFEKSMWTTVAILGVLKAGGAFLLLDPSLPEKRLQFMVHHVDARLLLSSYSTRPLSLRLLNRVMTIENGLFQEDIGVDQRKTQSFQQDPSSLLYVVFTSGSTGIPKCVQTTHINVASALYHQVHLLGMTASSRIFDFASYSFTTAIWNVFSAFAVGGCLCVPNDQAKRDDLAGAINLLEANLIDLTPSVAQMLVPEDVPIIKTIVFGGEVLRIHDVERWWGKSRIVHLYGQSECTSQGVINHEASRPEDLLHVGKGAGLVTWIVDPGDPNRLLPPGCVGEVLFEGPLIGTGYLKDALRTKEVLIQDPQWLQQGTPVLPGRCGILYKTGDLGRYNESGSLTITGRKDTQIKLRGQRVEVGEVEHWVQHYMIEAKRVAAEVIKPNGENSSPTLVAFLQINEPLSTSLTEKNRQAKLLPVSSAVEDLLAEHLPTYMIPTIFFSMQELPMTTTGKINRKQLREIGSSFSVAELAKGRTVARGQKRQPSSTSEKQLQNIWAEVLNISPATIGLDDNFFHLGGDSVAAVKVVGRIRKLGIDATVEKLFRLPKLHDLANQGSIIVNDVPEDIPPFALLGDGTDKTAFLQNLSEEYSLEVRKIIDAYPCIPLQEGLVSLGLRQAGNYIIQAVHELTTDTTVKAFCEAWEHVHDTMPILRTRIVHSAGPGLMQLVLDEPLHWVNATGLDTYIKADKSRPMNLGDPFTRFALIKDSEGSIRWFVWTMHHALYDGWSMGLIINAVHQTLQRCSIDGGPQVQPFIKYVKDQKGNKALEYWQKALTSYDSAPFPPLPQKVVQPQANAREEFEMNDFKQHSSEVTMSTLVRAAWALVIGRMTRSEDVVFGATVSGRNAPVTGIESMVVPTFATIPLRIQLDNSQTVAQYIETVQRQAVDMIPFEQTGLQRIANLSSDAKRACMFQSLLVVQPQKVKKPEDLLGNWQETEWFNTYALTLQVWPKGDGLLLSASFDTQVLNSWLVRKLMTRLQHVIKQLVTVDCIDEIPLSRIDEMAPSDIQEIWEWNGLLPEAEEKCAHELIQERVQAQPNAPAVHAWDGSLSYAELDKLASRLIAPLIELGVKPGRLVPLCFEKSMWTPVAMLGVLKAGGAFVALETGLPLQRLQTIVKQLNTEFILSSKSQVHLSSQLCSKVIEVDHESGFLSESTDYAASVIPPSSTPMFVVFTSGSTGIPKGILLSHRNFCTSTKHQLEYIGFSRSSRTFQFASYAFDISVHDTFATFISGGCLCIPAEEGRRNNISKAMAEMRVTIADLTPSVARLIDPLVAPQIETIILTGEALSLDDVLRWWGKCRVVNVYGPAETHIVTVNWQQTSARDILGIGKGMGVVTWIVDPEDHNSLVPPGYIGELIIEGPLVALGYLNDPVRTEAAFIGSPTWLSKGAPEYGYAGRQSRLYKSGDLVRYNEDGSLTYLGRKDAQLKINGQRVELGEIEHWILQYTNASHVVAEVISPRGASSTSIIAAFLRTDNQNPQAGDISICPNLVDIETHLNKHIPHYMVPRVYFNIRQIPRSASGKTDRRKLRELGSSFSMQEILDSQHAKHTILTKRQPESDAEQKVQALWAKVLNVESHSIGADDSFIGLGGNSMSMMTLVSEARKFGLQITVTDVFEYPRLHQLASHASYVNETVSSVITVPQSRGDIEQSTVQEQIWLSELLHPGLKWNLMPWAVQLRGPLQLEALRSAIMALEERHANLRTLFKSNNGVKLQGARSFQRRQLKVVDLVSDQSKSLGDVLQQDRTTPFDLKNEPGWRVSIYQVGRDEHVLSIVTHQIVSDGWSFDILRKELSLFYSAVLQGQEPLHKVDTLYIQYHDYALWQRQQEQENVQQRQLGYWTEQLRDNQPAEFVCDKARPLQLSGETASEILKIGGALYDGIQNFRKEQGVTLFNVLLTAFRLTHHNLTGMTDATIGTAHVNRDRPETRDMIGHLVNPLCLRIEVKDQSFEKSVHQVRSTSVTAFANLDVPFERIVSELEADTDLSRHPLIQTIFAVHPQSTAKNFTLEGIEVEPIPMPITMRFDIELHIYEEGDELQAKLTYSTDLYEVETIRTILSTFEQVLEVGLARPTASVTTMLSKT